MKVNFYTIKNNILLNIPFTLFDRILRLFNYYLEFECDDETFIIQKIKIRKNYV